MPWETCQGVESHSPGECLQRMKFSLIQCHAPALLFKIQPHRYSPALGGICWISAASLGVQFFSWGVISATWRNKMSFVHVANLTKIWHLSTGKNERLLQRGLGGILPTCASENRHTDFSTTCGPFSVL